MSNSTAAHKYFYMNEKYCTFTGNLYSWDNYNFRIPFILDTLLKKENVVAVESPGMCHTGVHRCVCAAHGFNQPPL